jgi:putative membrane-bound dehydrogenase-like protein
MQWLCLILLCWASTLHAAKKNPQPIIEKPFAPLEAARTMQVPKGFNVTLFAGEPDIKQPIGFCIDDRGRLWVAEANNYPDKKAGKKDLIIILEDTDGDGRHDKRIVFYDKLEYVSGIEVGFGGVWVMSIPNFYFIPDKDYDGVPDGKPVVLLDGFGTHANAHNIANGFAWGPDGWLYGTHGVTNWSLLGKPGTPEAKRRRFEGGVWRYHPVRHVWESFAIGTTNPWGIDWNEYGHAFVCNCVNPHLFHIIQGAHYEPARNRPTGRFAYERIPTIADHLHFTNTKTIRAGIGTPEEDVAGGGHAHSGTMIYLGDNWPAKYRGDVFMNNIHGRRINHDRLARKGSGYTATHAPDVMRAADPWFVGVTLAYGPDGGVYVSDFSDTGECHHTRNTQKHTGRIYKITYGKPKPWRGDIGKLGEKELMALQTHQNEWFARHARRVMQERFAVELEWARQRRGSKPPLKYFHLLPYLPLEEAKLKQLTRKVDRESWKKPLWDTFERGKNDAHRLRSMWALHVIGALTGSGALEDLLRDKSEHLRAWAIQLLCENKKPSAAARAEFARMAREDKSPLVRLYLASAMQRLPVAQRVPVLTHLLAHAEDAPDQNLPLMYWYATEPVVAADKKAALQLLSVCKIPKVRQFITRRMATGRDAGKKE